MLKYDIKQCNRKYWARPNSLGPSVRIAAAPITVLALGVPSLRLVSQPSPKRDVGLGRTCKIDYSSGTSTPTLARDQGSFSDRGSNDAQIGTAAA